MNNCQICSSAESKYKCPTCLVYYCSLTCCRVHREDKCELNIKSTSTSKSVEKFATPDSVPDNVLDLLRDSKNLRDMLSDPQLKAIMTSIDSSSNPAELIHKAMQEPVFTEFANECLKVVEPQEVDKI